jgi:hypothetical protein
MFFLNYPFIKMGTPFWLGFVLYSAIGLLGILLFRSWAIQKLNIKPLSKEFYSTAFVFFIAKSSFLDIPSRKRNVCVFYYGIVRLLFYKFQKISVLNNNCFNTSFYDSSSFFLMLVSSVFISLVIKRV